jgi:hypothetical protein
VNATPAEPVLKTDVVRAGWRSMAISNVVLWIRKAIRRVEFLLSRRGADEFLLAKNGP